MSPIILPDIRRITGGLLLGLWVVCMGVSAQELAYVPPPPAPPVEALNVRKADPDPTPSPDDLAFDPLQLTNRLLNGHDWAFMAQDQAAALTPTPNPPLLLTTAPTDSWLPKLTLADRSVVGEFRANLGELTVNPDMLDHPGYRSELDREVEHRIRHAAGETAERVAASILANSEWLQSQYETVRTYSRVSVNYEEPAEPEADSQPNSEDRAPSGSSRLRRLLGEGIGFDLAPHLHGYYPGYQLRLRAPVIDEVSLWHSSALGIYADGHVRASIARSFPVGRLSLDARADILDNSQRLVLSYGLSW